MSTLQPMPAILRDYWHPVARSAALGDKPLAAKLLDTELVLWRSPTGVAAFRDLCIHRGTRLSLGWVEQGELVCPYHGWCYRHDGAAMRIPSVPADRPIPAKARADKFHCAERYGLIFVCLGEPKQPVPAVPEFEQAEFGRHIVGPVAWRIGAARSLENFIDEAHLPWVHDGVLGDRQNIPVVPQRDIQPTERGFHFEYDNRAQRDRVAIVEKDNRVNRMIFDVLFPFTLHYHNVYPNGGRTVNLFFSVPVAENECRRVMVVGRNFGLEQPPDKFIAFTEHVWEQDRVVIESQRPEQVPLDWDAELHVRGPDGPATAYRKLLSERFSAASD